MIFYEPNQIKYSNYAEWKMRKRNITKFEVEQVLADPDNAYPPTPGSPPTRKVYDKNLSTGRLRVVFEPTDGEVLVINALVL
jgi:hypothetical protein